MEDTEIISKTLVEWRETMQGSPVGSKLGFKGI